MDHSIARVVFYAGLAAVVLGALAGMRPLWRSSVLSPASIQRRPYWTGSAVGAVLVFLGQLPDWRSGLAIASAVAFVMTGTAWRFTSHLKIGDTVYAASRHNRRPDPPPALPVDGE
jgi:hypothetical protein